MRTRACRICLVPCLVLAGMLPGCVADKPVQRTLRAPADLRPDTMVIASYPLLDDDNNGYPDTIPIVVYLWDERYPLPLWEDGIMRFRLSDENKQTIAEWDVPADVVSASRRRDQVGAAHQMTLDIRDATSDVRPLTNARLMGEFVAEDGVVADCGRALEIRIGS